MIHIQGLLAVPFVLHSQPTAVFEPDGRSVEKQASVAQQRYAEIFRDVEYMINDHSESWLAATDFYISTFLNDH
jgi:IMP and pyridine-specific 5'-nucleotidase